MSPSSRYEHLAPWMRHGERIVAETWTAVCTSEAVPFQLEGQLNTGELLYWRSRHVGWQFGIGPTLNHAVDVAMHTHGSLVPGAMGIRQVVAAEGHPLGSESIREVAPIIDRLVEVYRAGFALLEERADVR